MEIKKWCTFVMKRRMFDKRIYLVHDKRRLFNSRRLSTVALNPSYLKNCAGSVEAGQVIVMRTRMGTRANICNLEYTEMLLNGYHLCC